MQNAHIINEKLKSLSIRILNLTQKYDHNSEQKSQTINLENIKYNLAGILSEIIIKLNFKDRSKQAFLNILKDYNKKNKTSLNFGDFFDKCWIRVILGNVLIPEHTRYLFWSVKHNNDKGTPIDVPEDVADIFECLRKCDNLISDDANGFISQSDVEHIINEYGRNSLDLQFLLDKNILEHIIGTDNYKFGRSYDYFRNIGHEVFIHIWLSFEHNSSKVVTQILKAGLFQFNKLDKVLSKGDMQNIGEVAYEIIMKEADLASSDREITKVWLDHNDHGRRFNLKPPFFSLNCTSAYDLITSIKNSPDNLRSKLLYQIARESYDRLLNLIVCTSSFYIDDNQNIRYQHIVDLLKDTSKPYIPWKLYNLLQSNYSYIIPYLLVNQQTAIIALELIDDIRINELLLTSSESSDYIVKTKAELNIKNQLWLEMFNFLLDQIENHRSISDFEQYNYISLILSELANKVFKTISINGVGNNLRHESLLSRYKSLLDILTTKNFYREPYLNHTTPKIINSILPMLLIGATEQLEHEYDFIEHGFLAINCGSIYHAIELLKITNKISNNNQYLKEINTSKRDLINKLFEQMTYYYTTEQVKVKSINVETFIEKKPSRGVSDLGFEIIDWGYAYLEFMQNNLFLITLDNKIIGTIIFDIKSKNGKYEEQNKEQYNKIKTFLTTLMLAYIEINKNKNYYETQNLPVKRTIVAIEDLIKRYSINYSIDNIPNGEIDVFKEIGITNYNSLYYQSLSSLLYKCISYFDSSSSPQFIQRFFERSIDIGRMLSAINMIDFKKLENIIAERIKQVDLDEYVNSVFTITELQQTLIDATNSELYWKQYAKQLFEIVKNHFEIRNPDNQGIKNLLFEISLLLALKANNKEEFHNISPPEDKHAYPKIDPKNIELKKFYEAMFEVHYNKSYDLAISKLAQLQAQSPRDIRYAFHIYHTKTLKAVQDGLDLPLLTTANIEVDKFAAKLNNDELKEWQKLDFAINFDRLFYLISANNSEKFDQTFDLMPNRSSYDEDIIIHVYNFYIKRGLHELALYYFNQAKQYMEENSIETPEAIQRIFDQARFDGETLEKTRLSMVNLRSLRPQDVPRVIPDLLNGKRNFQEFILNEFIQASRVLLDKIKSIEEIPLEDSYNDLLLATLRLRFSVWGWNISDQNRLGKSSTGLRPGEVDIVIEAGGNKIALIEALVLKNKNKTQIQEHILRCFKYSTYLGLYIIIVYYKGSLSNFDKTWQSYKTNVINIEKFPVDATLNTEKGFIDLSDEFNDVRHLQVAKTFHGSKITMFHLMINLSLEKINDADD